MRARYPPLSLALLTCLLTQDALAHPFTTQGALPADIDAVVDIGQSAFKLELFLPDAAASDDAAGTDAVQEAKDTERLLNFMKTSFSIRFTSTGTTGHEGRSTGWAHPSVSLSQTSYFDRKLAVALPTWVAKLEGPIPKDAVDLHVVLAPAASQFFGRITYIVRYGGGALEKVLTKEASETEVLIPARLSLREVVGRYVTLGFFHIIPEGLDHILFVLGLFLLSTSMRALLWQISAFTLAHSVTLGLSMASLWQMPGAIIEPIVAASIAYVAVENIFTSKLNPWRPALVFALGLLHGLGFAGFLGEIGIPKGAFFTALVAFNVGVEAGQLSVIAVAFGLVFWVRNRPAYRAWVVIPASSAIALVGIYWTIERLVSLG